MDFLENCGLRPIYTNKKYMNSVKSNLKYFKFDISKFSLSNEQNKDISIKKSNNEKINKKPILFSHIYDCVLYNKDNKYNVDINDFTSSESESEHESDYEYYSD